MRSKILFLAGVAGALLAVAPPVARAADTWETALGKAKIQGGLCVIVGSGEPALAVKLAKDTKLVVHWLMSDPAKVAAAQESLSAARLYGKASAEVWAGPALPYADNLVSLLLLVGPEKADPADWTRVVRPGGEMIQLRDGQADVYVKPRPGEMDEWTHWRHGPDRNPVSHDRLVEVPRRIQWLSIQGKEGKEMVTANGRCFYFSGAALSARDAFNGLPLWTVPAQSKCTPVAAGDSVFAVHKDRLMRLDASSGREIHAYPEAGKPGTILFLAGAGAEGGLLVVADDQSVRAIAVATGQVSWTYPARCARGLSAGDGAVFVISGDIKSDQEFPVAAIDLATGKPRWEKKDLDWARACYRSCTANGVVAFEVGRFAVPWKMVVDKTQRNAVHFLSARDGRLIRTYEYNPAMRHDENPRTFFVGNQVALHRVERDKKASNIVWFDDLAAEPRTFPALPSGSQYFYCFPPTATDRFFLYGQMSFTDWKTHEHLANPITRGTCGSWSEGLIPANGLVYVFPKDCNCFSMLSGAGALAPACASQPPESQELVKGPAFGAEFPAGPAEAGDWPCLRGNEYRSGSTPAAVDAQPAPLWKATLDSPACPSPLAEEWKDFPFSAGPLTPPVVAGGLVVVAQVHTHRVIALGADDGKPRWEFVANARVDSPPTLWNGLCLFGCRSGWVYCLRASDGALVWRLRAAPCERRIVHCGQVESPWPVAGSVLVADGTAYFSAGMHPLADGGVRVFAADPRTGAIRWKQTLTDMGYDRKGWHGRAGLEQDYIDLLVKDGGKIAMSRWVFDPRTGQNEFLWHNAYYRIGEDGAYMQRGTWSYGYPMNRPRMHRPLLVARGSTVLGANRVRESPTLTPRLFRRDFKPGENFNVIWDEQMNDTESRMGVYFPANRIAQDVTWSVAYPGWIEAMALAGDNLFLYVKGKLQTYSAADGKLQGERELDRPVWDGLAAARGRLYVSTMSGTVQCLGRK